MLTRLRGVGGGAAALGALAVVLAACGGSSGGGGGGTTGGATSTLADCDNNPTTCNSAPTKQGGTLTWSSEKNFDNWNNISAAGNTADFLYATDGIYPWVVWPQPDLSLKINNDVVTSYEMTKSDPQTVVAKINPNAVWSDGTPVSADDFIYTWKAQDPAYCPKCDMASSSGFDQVQSMTGSDNGKTLTIVYKKFYADWLSMFQNLLPAHIAKQHGDITTPAGLASTFNDYFEKTVPTWSMGPYKIQSWTDNQALVLVPNDKWWGKKPSLDKIVFRVITDSKQEPIAFANNEVQVLYMQPEVDLISQVKNVPNTKYTTEAGLVWEHFDFNIDNSFLKDKALREALFTAVNRQEIISKTVGQFDPKAKPLNNHMFVPGQKGYEDNLPSGQGSGDIAAAKKILTDAGYTGVGTKLVTPAGKTVPTFNIRYTVGNAVRQSECELFASYAKKLGVTVKVQPTDSLGGTLSKGDFDIIVFAWVNSPAVYSGNQQLWVTGAGGNYGHYSNKQVDNLINEAASTPDDTKGRDLLNQADKILSSDAYVLPLYQKPQLLAVYDNYANIRDNPTNATPGYNIGEWGLRASAS